MAIDLKAHNIDPDGTADENLAAAMLDLQGNILKSHGRDHSKHLFLRFGDVADNADGNGAGNADSLAMTKDWLATTADRWITSARRQWDTAKERAKRIAEAEQIPDRQQREEAVRRARARSTVFVGLLLSAPGYRRLGYTGRDQLPSDPSFLAGAKDAAIRRKLNDPDPADWDQGFNQDLDALVIVAADSTAQVDAAVQEITGAMPATVRVVHRETGNAMRLDAMGRFHWNAPVREHFGFLDGISNPQFFAKDVEQAAARMAELGGPARYDPGAELGLALVKDPGGGANGYGSYFIYRKLQQHVPEFRQAQRLLAGRLATEADRQQPSKEHLDLAAAFLMGRFQDGTPLANRGVPGGHGKDNDFDYADDLHGGRCPFPSHTRKANPRGDTAGWGERTSTERSRRIVRRGISYGPVTLDPPDGAEVGMLFLAAQSSIKAQFEVIQGSWCNADNFPAARVGIDPISGQIPHGGKVKSQKWPRRYGDQNGPGKRYFDDVGVGPLVTMRGAEYFFAPSLSFLSSQHRTKE